ncbi:pyridoxamine 5'-phosphate oxidase, partial [Brevundimonas sp. UBA7838]|uniref:pyridoxamine 5'-phosphate oxidase n=1 Tax=Brevundimonas sp. UBA7838 TaxID=1946142 RepID=UPI0039C89BA5
QTRAVRSRTMTNLYAEALSTFAALFEEAKAGKEIDATAMTVATADLDGRPSARTVLLKAFDERGFVFYTHLDSRKGRELHDNRATALLFLWRSLREAGIQVRIEGDAQLVSATEADAYFASRARESRIGAWASDQSRPLSDRTVLEEAVGRETARFDGQEVPRPSHWTGWRVVPRSVEFWRDRPFRLHDRLRFDRDGEAWRSGRLWP